jgi:hypothetical protein
MPTTKQCPKAIYAKEEAGDPVGIVVQPCRRVDLND